MGFVFILLVFLNIILANINDYTFIKNTYHNGEYNVVEGKIENFIPMKIEGHSKESFTVDEVEFS